MRTLTQEQKTKLVHDARALVGKLWPEMQNISAGRCVHTSLCLMVLAIKAYGYQLLPQGGSMFWRFVPQAMDDGKIDTYFGYEWQGFTTEAIRYFASGNLPEMHVWLCDPQTKEVIDPTTFDLPKQAKESKGFDWHTDLPPDYLWTEFRSLPKDALYRPSPGACYAALELLSPDSPLGLHVREYFINA